MPKSLTGAPVFAIAAAATIFGGAVLANAIEGFASRLAALGGMAR